MAGASIDTSQLEVLLRKFGASKAVIQREIKAAIIDSCAIIQRKMAEYPPELPYQIYVRTHTLGVGWEDAKVSIVMNGGANFKATVTNDVPYSPYVQDILRQVDLMQGRWITDEEGAKDAEPEIEQRFVAAVQNIAADMMKP